MGKIFECEQYTHCKTNERVQGQEEPDDDTVLRGAALVARMSSSKRRTF